MDHFEIFSNLGMWSVISASFLFGFLGSFHCVSMCGPLVISFSKNKLSNFVYQVGRIISYSFVGYISGLLGKVFVVRSNIYLSFIFISFFGSLIVFWGIKTFFQHEIKFMFPAKLTNIFTRLWNKFIPLSRLGSLSSSFVIGILTIFLPCGFLFGFALITTTLQNSFLSTIAMLSFSIGTIPVLFITPGIFNNVFRRYTLKVPRAAGIIIIVIGLIFLGTKYKKLINKSNLLTEVELKKTNKLGVESYGN